MTDRVERSVAHVFFAFTPKHPCTYKGVGSHPRRKSQPAWVCAITTECPDIYKASEPSRSETDRDSRGPEGGCNPPSVPGTGRRERGGVRHVVRIHIECRVYI